MAQAFALKGGASGNTLIIGTGIGGKSLDTSAADVSFGALTLAGAGATPLPNGTSITDAGGTNLVVSGTDVVPDTGGGVSAGTVTTNAGTFTVEVNENTYSVASMSEMSSAITAASASGNDTIRFRDGDYSGGSRVTINKAFTGTLTIDADTYRGATLGPLDLDGCDGIKFHNLKLTFAYSSGSGQTFIVELRNDPSDLEFKYCHFFSDDFSTLDLTTEGGDIVAGIAQIASTTSPNLNIEACHFEFLDRAAVIEGNGMSLVGNKMENLFGSAFMLVNGDNITVKDNLIEGIYGMGTDSGNPHQGLVGWTTGSGDNLKYIGNLAFVTDRRFTETGDGHASGVRGFVFDDPSVTPKHTGLVVHHNIFVSSTGDHILDRVQSGTVYYNTFARDEAAGLGAEPSSLTFDDSGTDSKITHNIGMPRRSGAGDTSAHEDGYWHQMAANPPFVGHNGLSGSFSGETNFSNYEAQLTPTAGTYWDGKGAIGTGFTFASNHGGNTYTPSVDNSTEPTILETTTSTGQSVTTSSFDGSNDYLSGGSITLSGNVATIMAGFKFTNDSDDGYLWHSTSGTFGSSYIRRTASVDGLLFNLGSSAASLYVGVPTQNADDFINLIVTMNGATGEYRFWVNGYPADLFTNALTRWTTGTLDFNNMGIGASSAGSLLAELDFGYFWMDDVIPDIDGTQGVANALLAQDGGAPNFASDGSISGISLAQPQVYLVGTNTGASAGDNAGSGSDWTVNGSPA